MLLSSGVHLFLQFVIVSAAVEMSFKLNCSASSSLRQSLGMPLRGVGGGGMNVDPQPARSSKMPSTISGQNSRRRQTCISGSVASHGSRSSRGNYGAGSQQRQSKIGIGSSRPSTVRYSNSISTVISRI